MASRDNIPRLLDGRSFPLGDAIDMDKEKMANEWITEIEKQSQRELRLTLIRSFSRTALSGLSTSFLTHHAAINLTEHWDKDRTHDPALASCGYLMATAFRNATNYFPLSHVDFTKELTLMKDEPLYPATMFAQTAWKGMESYRHIHAKFDRLYEHALTQFEMYSDDERQLFRAGMALPYIISSAGLLAEDTPDFTSLSGEKVNLATDFRKLFI